MERKTRLFRNKWKLPFHLCSAFLPGALLIGAYAVGEAPYAACLFPGIYLIAAMACMFMPDRSRLVAGLGCCAAILFAGFRMVVRFSSPLLAVVPALYAWLILATLPLYAKDSREEMPPHVFITGILLHLAGQAALFVAGRTASPVLDPVKPALSAAFACFFLLTLLNLNRTNLIYVAAMESAVPRHIYRLNRLLTVFLAALTILIGCMPAVIRFFKRLWNALIGLIAALLAWLHSLLPPQEPVSGGGAAGSVGMLPAAEESQPGLMAKILDFLMYLVLIAAAILALWAIQRCLRRFARWLWQRIKAYAASAGAGDYVDEISDTREDGRYAGLFSLLKRKKDPLRGIDARALSPTGRVRFYYLRLLARRGDHDPARTAREDLPVAAAEIYERARYSEREVSEADAGAFLRMTESHR